MSTERCTKWDGARHRGSTAGKRRSMDNLKTIDTFSTEDLLNEILNRCKPAIFVGYKHEGGQEGLVSFYHYRGNPHACRGMCKELDSIIQMEILKQSIDN